MSIDINKLSVSFAKKYILNNISLNFTSKQITTIVGQSGSGKTTLLRSLNRLNEEYTNCHTQGQVKINFGSDIVDIYNCKMDLSLLRQKVGMLFQTPQVLPTTIYKNIAMPLASIKKYSKHEINMNIEEMLTIVGLWDEVKDRLSAPAQQLSGGQQQRLCFARTLALKPQILLLDEPTSSLDINATQTIENLLKKLRQYYTIIIVSHSIEQACRLADKIIIMENGNIKNILEKPINITELNTQLSMNISNPTID